MISIPKIEADDVMGYLVQKFEADSEVDDITIMSADKDFLQLVSKKTSIYSPTKKKTYRPEDVLEEYQIHSHNFINYKLLMGDAGDNVPGVQGLGPKKLIKLFPELLLPKQLEIEDLLKKARDNESTNPLYTKVLQFEHQLGINYQLMSLKDPNISNEDKRIIDETIEEAPPSLNIGNFVEMTENDQLNERVNWQSWLIENFSSLDWKQ
jgi:5'-3' exonuclease